MTDFTDKSNQGLGYGVEGPLWQYPQGTVVRIMRGKNKGRLAEISYQTDPHPLSHERRYYLWLHNRYSFWSPNHVLMNESGFSVVHKDPLP